MHYFDGIYFFSLHHITTVGMKELLNYIWKNRLLPKTGMHTIQGEELQIISYGQQTHETGIFSNATITIGNKELHGEVIMHESECKDSDAGQRIGSSTVLLVTGEGCNFAKECRDTTAILRLRLPDGLEKEFADATQHVHCLPCSDAFENIDIINRNSYMSRLLIERIEEKASNILQTFSESNGLWEETLLKTVIRSFGFGIQSEVFERWAKILDFNAMGKHRDNRLQIEAIMFGQAGLLEEGSIPHYYRNEALSCSYFKEITREYRFLRNKFGLQEIHYSEWSKSNATPHVRIARIAALYCRENTGISNIMSCNTTNEYYNIIDTTLEGYWSNHTCFGGTETIGNGSMKQRQMDVIIINAIVPILYIYGKHRNDTDTCNKAEEFLHLLKSEENSIIKKWLDRGITANCAADSQAILQLEKRYCRMCNCTECRFAYHYIKERIAGMS